MSHPAGVGPNGQFAPGMSPQGSQRGGAPSPNPNDMQRGMSDVDARYNKCSSANLGQGSPTPGMMDPNQVPPNMRGQMMMGPNGQPMMRPPSSHPMAQGMNPQQQMEMMRQQGLQQMPNGQFAPGQQPGQPMPGQQPTPGGQPIGTPRQPNSTMPPPPAPQANAGGTQPSSPLAQPAPPTPSTTAKAKPGKKEAGKKVSSYFHSSKICVQCRLTSSRVPPIRRALQQTPLPHPNPNIRPLPLQQRPSHP